VALILVANLPAVPVIPVVNVNLGKDVTISVPLADLLVNLPLVSLTPVVHLDPQISPRVFRNFVTLLLAI